MGHIRRRKPRGKPSGFLRLLDRRDFLFIIIVSAIVQDEKAAADQKDLAKFFNDFYPPCTKTLLSLARILVMQG